jgi:integrase
VFGGLPVAQVDTALVLRALEAIWIEKHETATRLRGRLEKVLDWAKVRGYRTGENPARWKGHLDKLLPKIEKRKRVKHHPALPFNQTGAFIAALREQPGTAARALELLILTACRTGEVIGARWNEIDMDAGLWTIPAARTKTHQEHRIPLSVPAVDLLRRLEAERRGECVFPGMREGKPLSDMAMLVLLKRMERTDITPHGFRSSFRDWCAERTAFPREVCEMALGHAISNEVEAAYRRGDLFEKRRQLMSEWARYCGEIGTARGEVVSINRREA